MIRVAKSVWNGKRTIRRRKPLGIVLWQGDSKIDGQPIVVIATGIGQKSRNVKTGAMVQTWILNRDTDPIRAINEGFDSSTCGTCPLRGAIDRSGGAAKNRGRMCYVDVAKAPWQVWQSFHAGRYEPLNLCHHARYFRGADVRLGAYGDPCAAPLPMWQRIIALAAKHTGYSHMAHDPRFSGFRRIVMASVESAESAIQLQRRGWRTFRVKSPGAPLLPTECGCPAAQENGARVTCAECGLCNGAASAARSVAINAHGSPSRMATLVPYLSLLDGTIKTYSRGGN